jgi:hypothetical protein
MAAGSLIETVGENMFRRAWAFSSTDVVEPNPTAGWTDGPRNMER